MLAIITIFLMGLSPDTISPDPIVGNYIETPPTFPGGEEALTKFLHKNLRYPKDAKARKASGTVYVLFMIAADGKVHGAKRVGPPRDTSLEKEAIRVVNLLPAWIPYQQDGKNVPCPYGLPIRFTLPGKKE